LPSQQDAVATTGLRCRALVRDLRQDLSGQPTQASVSLLVNNLQNFTLMFTSVLRARVPELTEPEPRGQLTLVVEDAERTIGEVFDEARDILLSGSLKMTAALSMKLDGLERLLDQVWAQRVSVVMAPSRLPVPQQLRNAAEQLRAITELHAEEEDAHILALVLHLANLADAVQVSAKEWDRRRDHPQTYLHAGGKVLLQLGNVKDVTEKVLEKVEDQSLRVMLEAYSRALAQTIAQVKLQLAASALAVEADSSATAAGETSIGTPLLDLAFVTFPFMYNFRDACTLNAASS